MLALLFAATTLTTAPDTGKHVFFVGDAGLVAANGNSEFTSITIGDKLTLIAGRWKLVQTFGVTYARTSDSITTELWRASLRGDRALGPRVGLFALVDVARNTFAGVRYRIGPSFGVTALVVAARRDTLRAEIGGGYSYQAAVAPDTNRSFPAGRVAVMYRHRLGAKAAFDQLLAYIPDLKTSADYRLESESAIVAPITAGISMRAAYVIHHEGLPEPGFKKTDRILTTGVQVTF